MRNALAAASAVVLLTLAGCASSQSASGLGSASANIIEPELEIRQLSHVPIAARHATGATPVKYEFRVANRSAEWIKLVRVDVQSVGLGAYRVDSTSRPVGKRIEPDEFQTFEFWIPAVVEMETVVGANGPVTLRAVAHFDSAVGQFEKVYVRQVNAMPGRDSVQ